MSIIQIPSKYIYGDPHTSPISNNHFNNAEIQYYTIKGIDDEMFNCNLTFFEEPPTQPQVFGNDTINIVSNKFKDYSSSINKNENVKVVKGDIPYGNRHYAFITFDIEYNKLTLFENMYIISNEYRSNTINGAYFYIRENKSTIKNKVSFYNNEQDFINERYEVDVNGNIIGGKQSIENYKVGIIKNGNTLHICINILTHILLNNNQDVGTMIVNTQFSVHNIIYNETINKYSLNLSKGINLESNSLIQNETLINQTPIYKYNVDTIVREYKNGKQIIKIKCCVHNMYDENNNKVVDIKSNRKLIKVGDLVCPFKPTNQGDIPFAIDINGNAKTFKVIQHKLIFNGAIWQDLTLEEYINE